MIEQTAPLSDAEIEVIRADWQAYGQFGSTIALPIGRLLATLAAYREIVAAVAETDMIETYRRGLHVDDAAWDQLRSRARALLGTSAPTATDDATAQEG